MVRVDKVLSKLITVPAKTATSEHMCTKFDIMLRQQNKKGDKRSYISWFYFIMVTINNIDHLLTCIERNRERVNATVVKDHR